MTIVKTMPMIMWLGLCVDYGDRHVKDDDDDDVAGSVCRLW